MFFHDLVRFGDNLAAIDSDGQINYQQLSESVDLLVSRIEQKIGQTTSVIFLQTHNTINTLTAYLAALNSRHCVLLIPSQMTNDELNALYRRFCPSLVIHARPGEEIELKRVESSGEPIAQCDAAVLLSTSGSSGAAKYVALSRRNLDANSEAICQFLPILSTDRALCALPFSYAYGLSIINTHLNCGACCVFTDASPVSKQYWQLLEEQEISSFSGVPFTYELMHSLRFTRKSLPNLRYFTQAGGKLSPELVKIYAEYATQNHAKFFIMYGQTEATARMAYLDPAKLPDKSESIGKAIPNGQFKLIDQRGNEVTQPGHQAQLYYKGQNVMLGYVESFADLVKLKSHDSEQWLATGDIAYVDPEGDFYITGRTSRFLKLAGKRIDLDECEASLSALADCVLCTGNDKRIVVAIVGELASEAQEKLNQQLTKHLQTNYGIHPSKQSLVWLSQRPINDNGKTDYPKIMQLVEGPSSE